MALSKYLEEKLAKIPDTTYRENLRKAYEANPQYAEQLSKEIDQGVMRQEDYDRSHNALKQDKEKFGALRESHTKWHSEVDEEYKKTKVSNLELEGRLSQANKTIEELTSKANSGLYTTDQEKALADQIAAVKKVVEGIQSALGEKFVTQEAVKNEATQWGTFLYNSQLQLSDVKDRYEEDFGKKLPKDKREALMKFAHENNINDLEKAYDGFFAKELRERDVESKVQDRLKEELAKFHSEFPTSSSPSPMEMGHIQSQLEQGKRSGSNLPDDAPLSAISAEAAQELRSAGKF